MALVSISISLGSLEAWSGIVPKLSLGTGMSSIMDTPISYENIFDKIGFNDCLLLNVRFEKIVVIFVFLSKISIWYYSSVH